MNIDDIIAELRAFVREAFKIGSADPDFNDDVHLFDYGYVDSFGAVKLVDFIQERFHVTISDQDLVIHPLNTVREIATLVHQRLGEAR